MGTATDRITASDFLTPPELTRWPLAANPAGRIGGVRVELVSRPGSTGFGRCYQQVPLRLLPPFDLGQDQAALVYLLNPTAGLLDGDAQHIEIDAQAGSRAVVTGQSATRIHPCLVGFATQQWRVRVAKGAVLVVLPGPAIPFRGCRYYQRVEIDLAAGAGLVWGDVWLAGRYARGNASELFQFERLIQDLQVRRDGRLVFRDRFSWMGPWDEDTAAWHFGGHKACGTVFVNGSLSEPAACLAERAQAALFATAAGDTCLRWCGSPEAVVAAVAGSALLSGPALAAAAAATPWLLAGHQLAPNHWFNTPSE